MCLDIAAAAFRGIPVQVTLQKMQWFDEPFLLRIDISHVWTVTEKQFDHQSQIITLPVAVYVGFSGPDLTIHQYPGIEIRIRNSNCDRSWESVILLTEDILLVSVIQYEFAMTKIAQAGQQESFCILLYEACLSV
jgi:hypothetical protein